MSRSDWSVTHDAATGEFIATLRKNGDSAHAHVAEIHVKAPVEALFHCTQLWRKDGELGGFDAQEVAENGLHVNRRVVSMDGEEFVIGEKRFGKLRVWSRVDVTADGVFVDGEKRGEL